LKGGEDCGTDLTDNPDSVVAWSGAGVALQPELGLLAKRRVGFAPVDCVNPGAGARDLARPGLQ